MKLFSALALTILAFANITIVQASDNLAGDYSDTCINISINGEVKTDNCANTAPSKIKVLNISNTQSIPLKPEVVGENNTLTQKTVDVFAWQSFISTMHQDWLTWPRANQIFLPKGKQPKSWDDIKISNENTLNKNRYYSIKG